MGDHLELLLNRLKQVNFVPALGSGTKHVEKPSFDLFDTDTRCLFNSV